MVPLCRSPHQDSPWSADVMVTRLGRERSQGRLSRWPTPSGCSAANRDQDGLQCAGIPLKRNLYASVDRPVPQLTAFNSGRGRERVIALTVLPVVVTIVAAISVHPGPGFGNLHSGRTAGNSRGPGWRNGLRLSASARFGAGGESTSRVRSLSERPVIVVAILEGVVANYSVCRH